MLLALLLAPTILPAELAAMAMAGTLLLRFWLEPSCLHWVVRGGRRILPLLLIPLFGLVFCWSHPLKDILKDLFYAMLPIIPFLCGWLLARKVSDSRGLNLIVVAGLICGLFFLVRLLLRVGELPWGDPVRYRVSIGFLDMMAFWAPVTGLGLLVSGWSPGSPHFRRRILAATIIGLVATALTFSRLHLLLAAGIFGIFLFGGARKAAAERRQVSRRRLAGVVLVGVLGLLPLVPGRNGDSLISEASQELFTQQIDTVFGLTRNYRAYESAMALDSWIEGGPEERILGRGLGHLVDLKFSVQLVDRNASRVLADRMELIPILHNGYLYLLVKTGLTGLLCFLVFYGKEWMRLRRLSTKGLVGVWGFLARSVLLSTILATFVVSGPYNKGSWLTSCVILGLALGRMDLLRGVESKKEGIQVGMN